MRLSRIVADLLDLSRLESGSELGDPVRLDALVHEETRPIRGGRAARRGLTVVATDAQDPRWSRVRRATSRCWSAT